MASSSKVKPSRTRNANSISSSRRSSSSTSSTEVLINIYDLLPPGHLSSLLWTVGSSLLHTGVVVHSREYAYGGHNKRHTTGVYSTPPAYAPPGSTHRSSILAGYTYHTPDQIEIILHEVSDKFLGPSYNLLTNNCNHFTAALVLALTGKPAPRWLNRAASIGLALPCVVPREWISPPDADTAEGELLADHDHSEDDNDGGIARAIYRDNDDSDNESDGRASMLESARHRRLRNAQKRQREDELRARRASRQSSNATSRLSVASINRSMSFTGSTTNVSSSARLEGEDGLAVEQSLAGGKRITTLDEPPARLVKRVDSAGRELPVAERAPVPRAART